MEPKEFSEMVSMIRKVEKMMGSDKLIISPEQRKYLETMRKHIVAKGPIKKGEMIDESMLDCKRSSEGIYPTDIEKLIGKKAKRDIAEDEAITLDEVEQ